MAPPRKLPSQVMKTPTCLTAGWRLLGFYWHKLQHQRLKRLMRLTACDSTADTDHKLTIIIIIQVKKGLSVCHKVEYELCECNWLLLDVI